MMRRANSRGGGRVLTAHQSYPRRQKLDADSYTERLVQEEGRKKGTPGESLESKEISWRG
jgi:hypothetical protein